METRNRLKQEFQIMASKISKKFTDMMEAEIKDESFNNQAKLVKHNESAEWNFRFEAPSDGHYSGEAPPTTAVAAAAVIPEPIVEPTRTPFENAPHKRSTPGIVQEPGSGSQPSEAESLVTASTLTGQGPPPSGTAEYESFWIAFRNSSTNLPPVSLVKEALDIDGKTWEELRQDATNKIEENDLIELRWKEIQAAHPAMIQNFKGLHMNLFTKIKSTTFMELLCELTFHSARRGILERGRRKQHRQKVKEDVPATSGDPRLKNREARQAKTRGESVNTVSPRNAAAGSYEARLAHFEQRSGRLHALRASTNAVNRQAAAVVEGDAPARRYSPRKRSLSPSEDRQDVPKKVKLEPFSQDDTLSVVADLIDGESTAGTLPDYVSLN